MAKARTRKSKSVNNNYEERKNLQNGLYLHSSPPKVAESGSGTQKIREYIRSGNIAALEEVVLAGQGHALINQPSTDKHVRAFLKTVPSYISKCDLVHDAAERGNLRDLKALMDRRKLAKSKDKQGMGLLHKAVLSGNKELVDYLIKEYPETIDIQDKEGRTALHYTAATKKSDSMFDFLRERLNDDQVTLRDNKGKSAYYFMEHPSELSINRSESSKNDYLNRRRKGRTSRKASPIQRNTPPKRDGLNITGANIRIWIHDQDLPKLEQIVWEGQGHRLTNETSNNPTVRQFLKLVPRMMTRIKQVHQAPLSGDLDTLEAIVDQPQILIAKDHNGLNPLHRASALGHYDVCKWIVEKNPQTVLGVDKKGRTPLHYATYPTDGGEIYNLLVENGADPGLSDHFNKTPEDYRGRPGDIDISVVYDPPSAPRLGDVNVVYKKGPSSENTSRSTSASRRRRTEESRTKAIRRLKQEPRKNASTRTKKKNSNKLSFIDMKNVKERDIDRMVQDGDITKMENVILSGKGDELKGRSSWNDDVRRFLKKVPSYMEKITSLQKASEEGDSTTVRKLLKENPKYSMGRSREGTVALHHGAKSGNFDIVKQLLDFYPDGIFVDDMNGRAPIHWAGMSREPGSHETYDLLESQGSNVQLPDAFGKTANDYFKETVVMSDSRRNSDSDLLKRNSRDSLLSLKDSEGSRSKDRSRSNSKSRSKSRNTRSKSRNEDTPESPKRSNKSKAKNKLKSESEKGIDSRRNSKNQLEVETKSSSDSRSKSRNRSRSKSKSRSKSRNKSRSKSRSYSKSRSKKDSQSKAPSRNQSRSESRATTQSKDSKSNSLAEPNSKRKKRSRSRSKSRKNSDADKPKRKEKSRDNSRSPSRVSSPPVGNPEGTNAVRQAEEGNFDDLQNILLRGDGRLLLGITSNDEETQTFLEKVPQYIEDYEKAQEATENGELRTLKQLLDKKAKARAKDSNGSTLLHLAVLNGHTDIVRYLTEEYPELLAEQDDEGMSALHYAAVVRDGGHIYKILQNEGADTQMEDKAGFCPENYLHHPDFLTQKELTQRLKEKKADFESEVANSIA